MKASIIQKGDSFVLFFCSSNIFPCNLGFENISIYNGKNESHTICATYCLRKKNKLSTSLNEKDELDQKKFQKEK